MNQNCKREQIYNQTRCSLIKPFKKKKSPTLKIQKSQLHKSQREGYFYLKFLWISLRDHG